MKFEIYFDTTEKSFLLLEQHISPTTKEKMIGDSILIHEFESTYQDVVDTFQKFIKEYKEQNSIVRP